MKKTYLSKGFTLIELLVVIAIIGILSSIVLASLNTARAKGSNAAIKADLNNIRAQAELYYDNNGQTYGTYAYATCNSATAVFGDPNVTNALVHAVSLSADNTATGSRCVSTGTTGWASVVKLKVAEGTNDAWCVDSSGQSKAVSGTATIGAADVSC